MSSMDIRYDNVTQLSIINFADLKDDWLTATNLRKTDGGVLIQTQRQMSAAMIIHTKEHAENMVKSLNKALELGWFDNLK